MISKPVLLFILSLLVIQTTVAAVPIISSFSPTSGPVGTLITISGTNLNNPTSFTIGGQSAIVVSNTGSTLVAMVMPGTAAGTVSITTAGGTISSSGNFTVTGTSYPSTQQGLKLVGTGNTGAAQLGWSISLSADGNTALVGGYADNGTQGAAWVYIRSGGTWIQQGSKLLGTGNIGAAQQGQAVSLSADGNTAIVGGFYDNSGVGAAWVFTRSGGIWTQQGSKLVGTSNTGASWQGYSVSLSADGNTAIVGGTNDNANQGAAWVYTRSGGIWTQQGSKLVGTGNIGAAEQGKSVFISADGNTAIVGGFDDNSNQGAAWVYIRSGNTWTQQGLKLVGTGNIGAANQGQAVCLSADGNTAIVSGYQDNSIIGAVWIFIRNGGIWAQQGSKLVGTGNTGGAKQGWSVSLSADGNTAMVGGALDNNMVGAAWVYTRSGGTWNQQGSKLVGTGYSGSFSEQGTSVSLSADGNTALLAGIGDNFDQGATWVYTAVPTPVITSFSPTTGSPGTLVTINGTNLNAPTSLTIGGLNAIVVSNTSNTLVAMVMPGAATGTVSITTAGGTISSNSNFTVTGTPHPSAQQGVKLVGTGAIGIANQGMSVAISADGNTAITGSALDNNQQGAVWIYTRSSGTWTQQGAKLVCNDGVGMPGLGSSVAISADGNTAAVVGGSDNSGAGAVFIFTRSGGTWTQQGTKLVCTGGVGKPGLGSSVAISADGNTTIVGGYFDNNYQGAAWIFGRSGGSWTQQGTKLVGIGGIGLTYQGYSVSISADGNTAIVGGEADNNSVGAAWVYTRSASTWTQQGSKLVGTGAANQSFQGASIALNADGNTAIVGGSSDNYGVGAAWIFTRSGNNWTQQGSKLVGTGAVAASEQGYSVAVSADGNTAMVGGQYDNSSVGAAWVYTRNGGTWTQKGLKLVGTGAISASQQGYRVALSADGGTAFVGGPGDNSNIGAVWAYSSTVTDATLSALTGTGITLSPTFVATTKTYIATVSNAITSIIITPVTNSAAAMVKVNGTAVTPGSLSGAIALNVGNNAINIIVTAQDGITTQTYTLTVTRASSSPPSISYNSPQIFTTNAAIIPLSPSNTGGAVPATIYGQVSTFAGSGVTGSSNGTGTAASFYYPSDVATDDAGNIYVSDLYNNQIRKITPAGVVTTLAGSGAAGSANGTGTAASFNNPNSVALDAAGNVYVADFVNDLIRKITPAGVVTTLAGNGGPGSANGTGTAASFNGPVALATDVAGNVYVVDKLNYLIRKITPTGVVSTLAGSGTLGSTNGTGAAASFYYPNGITVDAAGNVYVSDHGNQTVAGDTYELIRKITPAGVVTTFAGSGLPGFADGIGTAASFNSPLGLATDGAGNVYVADENNNLIRKITPAGVVTTLAGSISAGTANGTGTAANFNGPSGVAIDGSGNLYVADENNSLIRKILITGYTISPALPQGLAFDVTTGIISGTPTASSPTANYTITAYNPGGESSTTVSLSVSSSPPNISYTTPQTYTAGTAITSLAPSSSNVATPGYSSSLGAMGSGFSFLYGVAVDAAGNVYVADNGNSAIKKIPAAGGNPVSIGSGFISPVGIASDASGNVYVADQGTGSVKKIPAGGGNPVNIGYWFNEPQGVAVDATGNVYITEIGNNSVIKVPATGGNQITIGTGFNSPLGVAVDALGNVYVADKGNNAIKKIPAIGGSPISIGSGFNSPIGVAVDAAGNVYVADDGNNAIKEIAANGSSTVVIGPGFLYPDFVAIDAVGNVYATTPGNTTIIKINPIGGYYISPALPAGLNFDSTTGIISGTPTVVTPATNYTVTAYNINGSSAAIVNLAIAPSKDATLSALSLSSATLNPVFAGSTTAYTTSVSNATSSINVTLKTTDANATVNVNGVSVISGSPSANIPLSVGTNTITCIVTAQDGTTTNTYTINVNRAIPDIYNLPPSNFQLAVTSASCKGTADGSINITAVQNLNYTATIIGNGLNATYPFSTSLNINNLSAGNYSVCLNIAGQTSYQQCYDLAVKEPQDLSVYTTINTGNTITLNLDGGSQYNIKLNGINYTIANNSITLPLQAGNNELTVTTDRLCQGTVNKSINYSDQIIPYPVPFQTTLNLNIGNSNINNVSVEIHNLQDGKLVYSNKYVDQSGVLQLDLTGLTDGVYALYLTMDNSEKIFKILKQ